MPQPRLADLRRFCEIDGWVQTTKGRHNPDHTRYRKILDDGRVLKTKVSHGRGSIADPALWHRIWHQQLALAEQQQFWEALHTGQPVDRATGRPPPPGGPSKPGWLLNSLIFIAGLPEQEAESLSVDEARARWLELCEQRR